MGKFDLIAKDYDTDKRTERARAVADEIRLYINDGNKKSAVEYGCGTGLVGFQLKDDFNKIVFVDSSYGMIEQVKQKLIKSGDTVNSAVCCDFMTDVPLNMKADCIFSSLVLHHVNDIETILSRFYNILYNNGSLLIVDLDTDDGSFHAEHSGYDGHNGFEQSVLIDMAEKVGFVKTEARTFYYDAKTVNGKEHPYSLFILNAKK